MSKPQRSQVKNYQKQSRIIIGVLFLLLAHTSLKLRSVKGIGQNVNGLQLSGQKLTKYQILSNAPGHLGFLKPPVKIILMEFPLTKYVRQPMYFIYVFSFAVLRYCFMFVYEDRPCFLHRAVCTCLLVAKQNCKSDKKN